MFPPVQYSISVNASPEHVWQVLTVPHLMKQWVGEPQMNIEIETTWQEGKPMIITGKHHGKFRNNGKVLVYKPFTELAYTHLSSVSRLPDVPKNHCIQAFTLDPIGEDVTELTVRLSNFPTESIYRHLDFYWRGTLAVIKQTAESLLPTPRV